MTMDNRSTILGLIRPLRRRESSQRPQLIGLASEGVRKREGRTERVQKLAILKVLKLSHFPMEISLKWASWFHQNFRFPESVLLFYRRHEDCPTFRGEARKLWLGAQPRFANQPTSMEPKLPTNRTSLSFATNIDEHYWLSANVPKSSISGVRHPTPNMATSLPKFSYIFIVCDEFSPCRFFHAFIHTSYIHVA